MLLGGRDVCVCVCVCVCSQISFEQKKVLIMFRNKVVFIAIAKLNIQSGSQVAVMGTPCVVQGIMELPWDSQTP